jgi:uncharacterized surface protein with fasciclin (FAS1) repeats
MKIRLLTVILLAFLLACIPLYAQEDTASVRFTSLTYRQESDGSYSSTADFYVDGDLVFEAIRYPFTTAYASIPAGEHQIVAVISGEDVSSGAAFDVTLQPGGQYSLVVYGDYGQESVELLTVDETELSGSGTGAAAAVNLYSQPVDIIVNESRVVENLDTGDYAIVPLPSGMFQASISESGSPETVLLQSDFFGNASTFVLAIATGTSPEEFYLNTQITSNLTIGEYLAAAQNDPALSAFAGAAVAAELTDMLSGEGSFTVFAPQNSALETLPEDADALAALVERHIVEDNLPPYRLTDHPQLTALDGSSLSLDFGATESGLWEIGGAPIFSHIFLTNGIIYTLGTVIP